MVQFQPSPLIFYLKIQIFKFDLLLLIIKYYINNMKKEFEVKCKNCGKIFIVVEEEIKFPIKGDKYFCCRSCANTRHLSKETKEKISNKIKNLEKNILSRQYKESHKYFCGSKELDELNLDISKRQSPKWFNKLIPFGFNINSLYTEKIINEHKKVKDLLYDEYVNNNLSPKDIYDKYNCKDYFKHSETLLHIFKDWNFPIRGWSKAVVNEWLQGKLIQNNDPIHYKQQWYTTWNNKEVYLHSSYELDYAKELDEQKIDYDVECLRIKYWDSQKQEYRCAIPDFYIPKDNLIVEIKSNWTLDKQNMKDKMKAYKELGYNFKLICDHKEINI